MKSTLGAALALAMTHALAANPPARIALDDQGVLRWRADGREVALFGANYCPYSSGDYRLARRVGADIKQLIDADLAHFARMGWDGMRLCTWGDSESSDAQGNRIDNVQMQLMDYQIYRAGERGISMLLSPIATYSSAYADQMGHPEYKPGGFSAVHKREVMTTNPDSIAAQANYVSQVLKHVNPYTGLALKDDPYIPFVEMINEPVHNSGDLKQSIEYINTLVKAVTSTGSRQITFHNYTQDFAIADALAQSKVQGISFGWYPTGLATARTQPGNFLHAVDGFPALLEPKLRNKPRIVYEFDTADVYNGHMYPAMARTFRSVGAQFAASFAYDTLATAQYNLSWQTHFINLVHTPRKAVSAVIAGEAMRRLPRMKAYGSYPDNTRFGDFSIDYASDASVLNAPDAFMHAGDTSIAPRQPASLKRVVGFGSSPLVSYEGTGAWFLDKIRDGVWRLEVYPNEILVSDPIVQPQPGKIVSRVYHHAWPMALKLPDLGDAFTATPLNVPSDGTARERRAVGASVAVEPGVWLLSRDGALDLRSLPATINRVGLREYHVNPPQTYPDLVLNAARAEYVAGAPVQLRVRVASHDRSDKLQLYVRGAGAREFGKPIALAHLRGYDYAATLDPALVTKGHYEFIVVKGEGDTAVAFPGKDGGQPRRWPFHASETWKFTVTDGSTPLELFNPRRDVAAMTWVRPSEQFRNHGAPLVPGETSEAAALSLAIPDLPNVAPQALYGGALVVGERIAARGVLAAKASALSVRLKATDGRRKTLDVLLIEKDGSSWLARMPAGEQWATVRVGLDSLTFTRSLLTPTPYPGTWSYWREGPAARAKGKIRPEEIERVELRVNSNNGQNGGEDARAVDVASVQLHFD